MRLPAMLSVALLIIIHRFVTSTNAFSILPATRSRPLIQSNMDSLAWRISHSKLRQSVNNHETTENATDVASLRQPVSEQAFCNTTVEFPSFAQLMQLKAGEFCSSNPFTVEGADGQQYDFCVKLYPRGGGHRAQYDVMSSNHPEKSDGQGLLGGLFTKKSDPLLEKVGIYLQYLPREDQEDSSVDATFSLRLKGNQVELPRFDVEWRAGMRFVPLSQTKLAEGQANDFGAHLLRTILLDDFLGVVEKDYTDPNFDKPVRCQVEVQLHGKPETTILSQDPIQTKPVEKSKIIQIPDLRNNEEERLRVGQVVVPVLKSLSQRPAMFRAGAYPGVEYRILSMIDPRTNKNVFYHQPGVDYEIKPIYPLVRQLERPWPVRVREKDIPKLITASQYNTISAVGSLLTAVTGLAAAWLVSQMISVFFIPSRSMEPTLQVGDVLLVEKVTPRLFPNSIKPDQVVLFHPPSQLQEIVARSGGRVSDRDLFVKRVAATEPGNILTVTQAGDVQINGQTPRGRRDLCTAEPLRLIERYITAGDKVVEPGQVAVLGDCASVSVDSRVWGGLPKSDIVGRPLFRIWPLERAGPIGDLPTTQRDLWNE